jgi:hypothetical protein
MRHQHQQIFGQGACPDEFYVSSAAFALLNKQKIMTFNYQAGVLKLRLIIWITKFTFGYN